MLHENKQLELTSFHNWFSGTYTKCLWIENRMQWSTTSEQWS